MAEPDEPPPDSKLTRSKQRWAQEGRFLTGKTSRPEEQRLPPGQHLTRDWPTLDLGLTPNISRERWRLDVYGAVEKPLFWDFAQFTAQPQTRFISDIHCVTTWSRYDNQWEGLSTRDLLDACRPRDEARFVVLHSHDGYTTNLALEDFAAEDALLAHSWSGAPLEQEHGGPVRLVVPHLYFWKSAKWLQSIEFLAEDAPGLLGSARLSQPRRSLEGRALFRGLDSHRPAFERTPLPSGEVKTASPWRQPVPTERFQFTSAEGHQLAAALDLPEGTPLAYALFAHCFTCGKDVLAAKRIAIALAAKGIAVLRFDFTGLGSSEGDFANSTFSSNVADLVRAADHLRETRAGPAILIGHSLGGAAILAAAGQIPDARAVVTIAAPSDPVHVTGLFKDRIEDIRKHGKVEVQLAGRPFHITSEFLDDIAEHGLMAQVTKLHKALLIMQSPTDDTVGIDNATHIFVAAKHPKSFVSLAGADHLLCGKRDAAYVADVIAAWAERYIDPASPEQPAVSGERAAQGGGSRDPQRQIPANHFGRAASADGRRARLPPAATIADPGPTISCSPASAPAPR